MNNNVPSIFLLLAMTLVVREEATMASLSTSSCSLYSELGLNCSKCDMAKGRWIADPEGPFYTNETCWTIQQHQNCMKNGRPDRDFLKWRWKPDDCDLPRFDAVGFLELAKGKTMAFVGDSLARNQMQSLMCLLSTVEYPEDISETSDQNFKRMYYASYDFTISIFWAPFLVRAEEPTSGEGPTNARLTKLYLDEPEPTWSSQLPSFHYLILCGGTWFTRPLIFYERRQIIGCQYCDVKNFPKISISYFHRMAFRTALRAIINAVDGTKMIILRTISPPHFENGAWDKGGDCRRTAPGKAKMDKVYVDMYRNQVEEVEVARAEGRRKGVEIEMMDVTAAMLMRPDGHPSGYWRVDEEEEEVSVGRARRNDCVHWCLPGPVDMWNDLLLQMMRERSAREESEALSF